MHITSLLRSRPRRAIAVAAAFAILSTIATNAAAQTRVPFFEEPPATSARYASAPGWVFFRTASFCYTSRANSEGRLLVGYDRRSNEAHIGFWSDERRAPYGDHFRAPIDIITVDRGADAVLRPSDDVEETEALVLDNSTRRQVFNIRFEGRHGLALIGSHQLVSFVAPEGQILQTFDLKGSAAAIARLRSCTPG